MTDTISRQAVKDALQELAEYRDIEYLDIENGFPDIVDLHDALEAIDAIPDDISHLAVME